MEAGIGALKTLKNGWLLIETEKKSELVEVCKKINEVSREELEGYMPTLKNLRIIVFNVPEDITSENVEQAIVLQNSGLNLNESEIKPKFVFEDRKKQKNLVIEMNSETRKRLVDRKLKTGWHVCNSNDYLSLTFCLKKFNSKKAPGEDGLTSDILIRAFQVCPLFFTRIYNACLKEGCVSEKSKHSVINLIIKPGREECNEVLTNKSN
jgi:hypothetical protein